VIETSIGHGCRGVRVQETKCNHVKALFGRRKERPGIIVHNHHRRRGIRRFRVVLAPEANNCRINFDSSHGFHPIPQAACRIVASPGTDHEKTLRLRMEEQGNVVLT